MRENVWNELNIAHRLAEAESDAELKVYLLKLAVDWTRVAQEELAGA